MCECIGFQSFVAAVAPSRSHRKVGLQVLNAMLGCRKGWALAGMEEAGMKAPLRRVSSENWRIALTEPRVIEPASKPLLASTGNDLKKFWLLLQQPTKNETTHLEFHSTAIYICRSALTLKHRSISHFYRGFSKDLHIYSGLESPSIAHGIGKSCSATWVESWWRPTS